LNSGLVGQKVVHHSGMQYF